MVINESGDVAKVISIWQKVSEDGWILEVEAYPCINDDLKYRATQRSRADFFKSESIVDVLIWYEDCNTRIPHFLSFFSHENVSHVKL